MVRKLFVALVTATALTVSVAPLSHAHAQSAPASQGADLIVVNAKIYTGNRGQPEATALAVKKGRIYLVGNDAEILAAKGSETRVIDARARRLIPGIIDSHTHIVNDSGYNYNVRWKACRRSAGRWRC